MLKSHHLVLIALLFAASASPAVAQSDGALRLYMTGGVQSSPADYDTFRPVDYDSGFQLGGGFALQLTERVAVRGEFAQGSNGGFEGGVLNEDVDFSRTYYGVAAELNYPVSFATPYLLLGAGLVNLDRTAPSYSFALTESAGLVGAGASIPIGARAVNAFVQGTGWVYPNSSTEEWHFDPVLSLGLGYTIPF